MARFSIDLIYTDLIYKHGMGVAMVNNMALVMVLKVRQDLVTEHGLGMECKMLGL